MKRFLSLVLSLVMVMSLVTVSAGAKDFTDDDAITYDEAVAVVSGVGIVDGYADGDFKPTNTLTRQAAAKVICNLILGPTTAAELHADTAPYPDVPTTSEFAGYIAFCQSRKIISGYSDGTFKPGNTLTGYAFMKMLLGALGYDASLEGYTGSNWSINVAKQALGIGLDDGLETKDGAVFNGLKAVNREEACLYAFNTLQADLVEYNQRLTTNINGTEVTLSSGGAQSRTWQSQNSRNDNIVRDNIMQFAEEYFNKLVKRDSTDKFNRPANTWLYDKVEIGTWTDFTLLVERYTAGVTGKDVYDLLGATAIADNTLLDFLDGADNTVARTDLVRSNKENLAGTGRGVLTEIFLDTDTDELTISSINTWLAQAADNYVEAKEYAPVKVFMNFDQSRVFNVDVEDVKNVVDVEDEEFYLVNISYKDEPVTGEVVILDNVEILEDSTVTKFSASANGTDRVNTQRRVEKLTTGGTEYQNNVKAYYDEDILDTYDQQLLTDASYNVFLDPYGYFIGVDLYEGTKNYVFITGFDRGTSNIAIKTADATGIFLDGTMDTIKVNVTETDKNIERLYTTYNPGNGTKTLRTANDHKSFFMKWGDASTNSWQDGRGTNGVYNLNQWYTYTENNGVYTLKPCARMTATTYPAPASGEEILRTDRLNVVNSKQLAAGYKGLTNGTGLNATRVYGEDETSFITVELDDVDTSSGARAITEVTGVYTGVQNVEIEINTTDAEALTEGQVYTVYDSDYFVIGAVVVGEARGANANYAYILSRAKSEEKIDDTYYWEFDAVMGGTIQTLTAKSKYSNTIDAINDEYDTGDRLVELRFDGDYVINIKNVTDIYGAAEAVDRTKKTSDYDFYDIHSADSQFDGIHTSAAAVGPTGTHDTDMLDLNLQGHTLYVTANQSDMGLALAADCKAVVIQDENRSSGVKTEFTSVSSAIARLAEAIGEQNTPGIQYQGRIVAALDSDGVARWILFDNDNVLTTGSNQGGGSSPASGLGIDVDRSSWLITAGFRYGTTNVAKRQQVLNAMRDAGLSVNFVDTGLAYATDNDGNMYVINEQDYVVVTLDGHTIDEIPVPNNTMPLGGVANTKTLNLSGATGSYYYQSYSGGSGYYGYNPSVGAGSLVINDNIDFTTGYVPAPAAGSAAGFTGSVAVTAADGSALGGYVKAGSSVKVNVTVNQDGAATHGVTVALSLANANMAKLPASQSVSLDALKAGATTLSFTATDITGDTGAISAGGTNIPKAIAVPTVGLENGGNPIAAINSGALAVSVTLQESGNVLEGSTIHGVLHLEGTAAWNGAYAQPKTAITGFAWGTMPSGCKAFGTKANVDVGTDCTGGIDIPFTFTLTDGETPTLNVGDGQ